jgi:hypothetical protein
MNSKRCRKRDAVAAPCIVPVAYGGLAGVILLDFERFLRAEMGPVLRGLFLPDVPADASEMSPGSVWSGFEADVTNKVEGILVKWGAGYGAPKTDAAIRIRYFISAYETSGCQHSFMKKLCEKLESFLFEGNMDNTKFSKHVVMWLCSVAPNLRGMLDGYFAEQLHLVPEQIRQESI